MQPVLGGLLSALNPLETDLIDTRISGLWFRMELIMGPPMGGIGACTTINTRGLLENIAVRAQVDCPLPANNLQLLAWAREATLYVLESLSFLPESQWG